MSANEDAQMDCYSEMRSPIDNAIIDLLLRADKEEQVRRYGLKVRHIRYVFGGYSPKDAEGFRWLDPYRREQLKLGVINSEFGKYSPQLIWNHCNKLKRMEILSKKKNESAYRLSEWGLIVAPSRLPHLRSRLRKARQEDCLTSPLITLVDGRRLLEHESPENEFRDWFMDRMNREAEKLFVDANDSWSRMKSKRGRELVLPLVVIDFGNIELHRFQTMRFG